MKDMLKKELESKKSNVKTMKVSNTGMMPAIEMPMRRPKPNSPMSMTTLDETPVFSNR